MNHEFPCGRCLPCKVNKNRVWYTRLHLELGLHQEAAFVTLTYKVEPPELNPKEVQDYLKRVRATIYPRKLRYYLVGEYGEKKGRPHYHLIIYGVSWTEEAMLQKCWDLGSIHVGDVNEKTIAYTIDYLLVKDTHATEARTSGRYPEFHRMSRGLGFPAIPALAASTVSSEGEVYLRDGDVPCTVRINGKERPLGASMMRRFRKALGRDAAVPRETGLLRTLTASAESAEDREKRRVKQADSVAARVKIKQSKRALFHSVKRKP